MRKLLWASLVVGLSLTLSPVAQAQESSIDTGKSGDYVFCYFLVLMLIAAGVAVVCSPAKRRDKAKGEDYSRKQLI